MSLYETLKEKTTPAFNVCKRTVTKCPLIAWLLYLWAPISIRRRTEVLLFDESPCYRVNLGCFGEGFYGYVNIDDARFKGRTYVSSFFRLPLPDNSVKVLLVDFNAVRKYEDKYFRIFKEWARILVPNAIVTIDNFDLSPEIEKIFFQLGFKHIFHRINEYVPVVHLVYSPPIAEFNQKQMYYSVEGNRLLITTNEKRGVDSLKINLIEFSKHQFNEIVLDGVIEYTYPHALEGFFHTLKKFLASHGRVSMRIRNELYEEDKKAVTFFDKGNLVMYMHETDFAFDRIEIQGDELFAVVRHKEALTPPANIVRPKKRRVCVAGQYIMFRYNQLGFDWDGIARAMDELGYETLFLETMRNMDYEELRKAILKFRPEYILIMLKEVLPFLEYIKDDCKRFGIKTLFWFTDPDTPWNHDYSDALDYMFTSSGGQVECYKKHFNIEHVYFMAQPTSPYIMYKHDIPEKYDVGFTGALSKASLHSTRRKAMDRLSSKYNVAIRNNVRNNVTEFNCQCKLVFGASDFEAELYTSNRIWVAMSAACCYVSNKFPGIERFARNREHLLWFETLDELDELVAYYLAHDKERRVIGENAARLIREKHTYAHRIHNMFDIVDGKTKDFYGFLS